MEKWKRFLAAAVAGALGLWMLGTQFSASASSRAPVQPNGGANTYTTYGIIVQSYLIENANGSLSRIEALGQETGVVVESYAVQSDVGVAKAISINSHQIAYELPLFGGYYQGKNSHYLVFGQENPQEDDRQEVLRIVRYDQNWVRQDSCSVYGANTTQPFTAGSLRMVERGGVLYLHTCHTMYAIDGQRHQANLSLRIRVRDMALLEQVDRVHNISTGYVSHSFNQFIATYGDYVYRVDHGDAYPRALVITRAKAGDSLEQVDFLQAVMIPGQTGANETGVSLGGFGLSADNCILAGNGVALEQEGYDPAGQRNVFLSITDQALTQTSLRWLTHYQAEDGVTPGTPQLVTLGSDQFLVMWEETYAAMDLTVTRLLTVDGAGRPTSDIAYARLPLSDCQPIVTGDDLVKWYVNQADDQGVVSTTMYGVDPAGLEALYALEKGDVDGDGQITIQDAYQALMAYARWAAGLDGGLLEIQRLAADVDGNGQITIQDASRILSYYAAAAAGNQPSWD